jgi:hypothetical protein
MGGGDWRTVRRQGSGWGQEGSFASGPKADLVNFRNGGKAVMRRDRPRHRNAADPATGGACQSDAEVYATTALRRRIMEPAAPKPMIIIAQVLGSGTAAPWVILLFRKPAPTEFCVSAKKVFCSSY